MRSRFAALAPSTLLCLAIMGLAGQAVAQSSSVGEVVVTSEKRNSSYNGAPHVTFVKRADNLITTVDVVCDTRDTNQRVGELKATLRNMIHAAGPGAQIELGLGDRVIGAFDETMLDAVIEPDQKVDTSHATVVVKTHVLANDTFDSATGRINAFIRNTPKVGRTEILHQADWSLTIINPEQYRAPIIAKIAADARETAAPFGPGYGVNVRELERTVDWYQSGPLDLALYIPYGLTIEPLSR